MQPESDPELLNSLAGEIDRANAAELATLRHEIQYLRGLVERLIEGLVSGLPSTSYTISEDRKLDLE